MRPLRVVTLSADAEREPALAARLGSHTGVELVLRCVDRVELLGVIRGGDLDAIVSVGAPVWLDRQAVLEAAEAGIRLVGISDDAVSRERLSSWGASVIDPDRPIDDVLEACRSGPATTTTTVSPSPRRGGRVIAVWGPKGAPGRTTIAIRLATQLAATEPATLLIDADPYGGDVTQVLGIVEELPGVVWAARLAARDGEMSTLTTDLRRAGPAGPVVLPGLPRAELWAEVSDFGWRELLRGARAGFEFTVCDVGFCLEPDLSPYPGAGEGRNRMARAAVAEADRVVAVCRADSVGIKAFLWALEDLRQLVPEERVAVVANRVPRGREHEIAKLLERHWGHRPVAYIPDRPREMTAAGRRPRRSEVAEAVRALTASLGGTVRSHGVMARLGGRA